MVSMTPELAGHGNCKGCGGDAAVLYEEVALCGSCFYIASLTAVRRASRLMAATTGDRGVAETVTMIATVVQTMRSRSGN